MPLRASPKDKGPPRSSRSSNDAINQSSTRFGGAIESQNALFLRGVTSIAIRNQLTSRVYSQNSIRTRWMLHVGARITEAALSLASGARSFAPTISTSSGSQVAPNAVEDWNRAHIVNIKLIKRSFVGHTGRHFAGVPMKK